MDLSEFDIDFLSQKLSDNPQSPLFARLADLYLSKNQSSEALKLCEAGVQAFSNYATGYVILGKCYLALNENSKARLAFSQAIHLAPFNQVARKLLDDVPFIIDEQEQSPQETTPVVHQNIVGTQSVAEAIVEEVTPQEPVLEELPAAVQPIVEPEVAQAPHSELPEAVEQPFVTEQSVTVEPVAVEQPATAASELAEPEASSSTSGQLPPIDEYLQLHASEEVGEKLISLDDYLQGAASAQQAQGTELDSLAAKLENAGRIAPPEPEPAPPHEESSPLESTVITPTLAEIYASQGEYGAAIQAYEILIFSKPNDRERFEKRIKELQAKLFDGG